MSDEHRIDWPERLRRQARAQTMADPSDEAIKAFEAVIANDGELRPFQTGAVPGAGSKSDVNGAWERLRRALHHTLGKTVGTEAAIRQTDRLLQLAEVELRRHWGWPRSQRVEDYILPPPRSPLDREVETVAQVSAIERLLLKHFGDLYAVEDSRVLAGAWGWLLALELGISQPKWLERLVQARESEWVADREGGRIELDSHCVLLGGLTLALGLDRIQALDPPRGQPQAWLHAAWVWLGLPKKVSQQGITKHWRDLARRHHSDLVVHYWRGQRSMTPLDARARRLYWEGSVEGGDAALLDPLVAGADFRPAQIAETPSIATCGDAQQSRRTLTALLDDFDAFEQQHGRRRAQRKRAQAVRRLVQWLETEPVTPVDALVVRFLLTLFLHGPSQEGVYAASTLRRYGVGLSRRLRAEFGWEDPAELSVEALHQRLERVLDALPEQDQRIGHRWLRWLVVNDELQVDPRALRPERYDRSPGVRAAAVGMPTWEALHAWLAPRDPTGVYRLMLDLMLLLGLREREATELWRGELQRNLLFHVAQRLGHGSPQATLRSYIHVPELLAFFEALNMRYRLPKAALVPVLGGHSDSYRQIEGLATKGHAPARGPTVIGVDPEARQDTQVTIEAERLWVRWARRLPASALRPGRRAKAPGAEGATPEPPEATPFLEFLWQLEAARQGDAESDANALQATLDAVQARFPHVHRMAWPPYEVALHRWRWDLTELMRPADLDRLKASSLERLLGGMGGDRPRDHLQARSETDGAGAPALPCATQVLVRHAGNPGAGI
ncbi:hypothetical protein [Halorhodospira halochloris]|uniref:hypothetical protein n=1 Tax=Halorhodospira halochloris TaxID=1052 RepID=UPI001EE905E2|nr:hypothetical protein [Halorhodospira halochloris]MCG5548916.1 hypothetical protein [Halorhodospira halochloris]